MKRFHNWQSLLSEFFKSRKGMPFTWGVNDCCLFAADAVMVQTGIDLAEGYRGTYADALGAARVLSGMGGVRGLVTARLGAAVPPKMARPGDVCVLENAGRDLLVVCGGTIVLGPGEAGLVRFPLQQVQECWRI